MGAGILHQAERGLELVGSGGQGCILPGPCAGEGPRRAFFRKQGCERQDSCLNWAFGSASEVEVVVMYAVSFSVLQGLCLTQLRVLPYLAQ